MNLEDFVKTMLYNREIENKKINSFEAFVGESGKNPLSDYTGTVKDALDRYERSRAGYGESGELLSRLNLAQSGYAAHLDEMAKERLSAEAEAAKEEKYSAENALKASYADFLSEEKKDESTLISSVLSKVSGIDGISYDAAFDYAVMRGLDRETATAVAEAADRLWKTQRRESVLKEITGFGLGYEGAKTYALAHGFSEEEAEALADAAEDVRKETEFRDFNLYG